MYSSTGLHWLRAVPFSSQDWNCSLSVVGYQTLASFGQILVKVSLNIGCIHLGNHLSCKMLIKEVFEVQTHFCFFLSFFFFRDISLSWCDDACSDICGYFYFHHLQEHICLIYNICSKLCIMVYLHIFVLGHIDKPLLITGLDTYNPDAWYMDLSKHEMLVLVWLLILHRIWIIIFFAFFFR